MASNENSLNDTDIPLCVDLDYTLISTDLSWEASWELIRRGPLNIFTKIIPWILKGKLFLKHKLVEENLIDVSLLPWKKNVIYAIKREIENNRPIYLVTGSPQAWAEKVQHFHNDLFKDAFGTMPNVNLTGKNKAKFLVEKFGEKKFDYIGDHKKDRHIWAKSRQALTVKSYGPTKRYATPIPGADRVTRTYYKVVALAILPPIPMFYLAIYADYFWSLSAFTFYSLMITIGLTAHLYFLPFLRLPCPTWPIVTGKITLSVATAVCVFLLILTPTLIFLTFWFM